MAAHYGLTVAKLTSASREQKVALPRQVAMYLCRELAKEKFQAIAEKFNKKDHTTVIAAVERIRTLMETDEPVRDAVQASPRSSRPERARPGRSAGASPPSSHPRPPCAARTQPSLASAACVRAAPSARARSVRLAPSRVAGSAVDRLWIRCRSRGDELWAAVDSVSGPRYTNSTQTDPESCPGRNLEKFRGLRAAFPHRSVPCCLRLR